MPAFEHSFDPLENRQTQTFGKPFAKHEQYTQCGLE